jgi:hypothetical protein
MSLGILRLPFSHLVFPLFPAHTNRKNSRQMLVEFGQGLVRILEESLVFSANRSFYHRIHRRLLPGIEADLLPYS